MKTKTQIINSTIETAKTKMKTKTKVELVNPSSLLETAKNWKAPKATKVGRKSILQPHVETIRYLRSGKKMNYRMICEFFNQNNVKTTYQNLIRFVKVNKIGK
jgi:hypothetical protein